MPRLAPVTRTVFDTRLPGARSICVSPAQLVLDGRRLESARNEQDVAVEPQVCELLDESLVGLRSTGERRLDALLSHLARRGARSVLEEPGDVRALRPERRTLGD